MPSALLTLSHVVNIVVAGMVGTQLLLKTPDTLAVFGGDTVASRILCCLYLAIALGSTVALISWGVGHDLRWRIGIILFPLQVFYKLMTVGTLWDAQNPVLWFNLVIAALHSLTWTLCYSAGD